MLKITSLGYKSEYGELFEMACIIMADSLMHERNFEDAEKILKNAFLYNKNNGNIFLFRKNNGTIGNYQRKITRFKFINLMLLESMGFNKKYFSIYRVFFNNFSFRLA